MTPLQTGRPKTPSASNGAPAPMQESARLVERARRSTTEWSPSRFGSRLVVEAGKRQLEEALDGPLPARSTPYQVLIVDDEPDILSSLKTCLEDEFENLTVHVAESGLEALHLMERESIDLIITDYKMPGMDGFELLAKAERIAPMVPRILITAYAVDVPVVSTEIFRVRHFFAKPLQGSEITAAVRTELAQRA